MNKIIGFIIIPIVCLSCKQDRKAEVSLSSYVYDFGMISPDSIYCDSIILTNVGDAKLDIGEIETGCGCTYASIDKYELNPKESCALHFSFNPKGKGTGLKEELIIINANTDSLFYFLQIKATIR